MEYGRVSPTLKVLREIREELRAHAKFLELNSDLLRVQGEELRTLRTHVVETEIRVATHLTGVTGGLGEIRDLLRDNLPEVRERLNDHERRLRIIERRRRK